MTPGALPQGAAMLQTTIAPTMLQASPKENVLASSATATINLRIANAVIDFSTILSGASKSTSSKSAVSAGNIAAWQALWSGARTVDAARYFRDSAVSARTPITTPWITSPVAA